jgi:hypothetical protein
MIRRALPITLALALAAGGVFLIAGGPEHPTFTASTRGHAERQSTSASPRAPQSSPWRSVAVGTVFESETATRLRNGATAPLVKTRQTVIAKDEEGVTLRVETGMIGEEARPQEIKVPYSIEPPKRPIQDGCPIPIGSRERPLPITPTTDRRNEQCTVPAGTYQCVKTRLEVRQGKVARYTDTWMADDLPVAVQSVTVNEALESTMRLTKVVTPRG